MCVQACVPTSSFIQEESHYLHCKLSFSYPVSCNRVQITCNTAGAHNAKHVVYHMVWMDSSAIQFDRVKIVFILALFCWLKQLTNEGGEGTGVPRENP